MSRLQTFDDGYVARRLFASRVSVAIMLVLLSIAVVLMRYIDLQLFEHERYITESEKNRVHVQAMPPTRGLIKDRNGVLLAVNRPSRTLALVKERSENYLSTLAKLQRLLSIDSEEMSRLREKTRLSRPFEPVPLRFNLSEEEIAVLAVNQHDLKGVEIIAELARYYPEPERYAHVIGYTGRINEREAENIDSDRYSGTFQIGKTGLERSYEDILLGQVGYQNVEVDAVGRVIRVLDQSLPEPGRDLELFLDSRVQAAAYDALGDNRGALVAIEIDTGGVLALASTPSFNANLFVDGVSRKQYAAWRDSPDLPLYNRAIQGQYPPGSTLKPVFALAGLHYGVIDYGTVVRDRGWYRLPNDKRQYRDWKKGGHSTWVAMRQAIEESCDVYFYDLAYNLGIDRLHRFSSQFGLGQRSGLDIPSERRGLLPSSEWKRNVRGQAWFPGETLSAGIGQGYMLVTPMQLAVATTVLATRGVRRTPRLVRNLPLDTPPPLENTLLNNYQDWDEVIDAMVAVVHGKRGTARGTGAKAEYKIAGKTGTAQVIGIAQDSEYDADAIAERNRDHKLFMGFAPAEDPQIAVAVVVENGGRDGNIVGAPLVKQVMDAYLIEPEKEGAKPAANKIAGLQP